MVAPVRVKICGLTNLDDALAAVDAGADGLGFILVPGTPRYVTPAAVANIIAGLPPFVAKVGVFVDEPLEQVQSVLAECGLDLIQLHGRESPEYCAALCPRAIKSFRVRNAESLARLAEYRVAAYLLDTYLPGQAGGTGQVFDWGLARQAAAHGRIILAGGLTPQNVGEAVRAVRPYAVDVSSGVEASPGRKDQGKLRAFVRVAKSAGWEQPPARSEVP